MEGAKWWHFGRRGGGSVLYINPNKHKIICNSVKTSVIREKMDIIIDILELSKTFDKPVNTAAADAYHTEYDVGKYSIATSFTCFFV